MTEAEQGERGPRGRQGIPGRVMSRRSTLILFVFVVLAFSIAVGLIGSQQRQLRQQQTVIQANTDQIIRARMDSFCAGIAYIARLNEQYDALIAIERSLASDPESTPVGRRVAKARIRAYTKFKTPIPYNSCPPR